MPRQPHSGPSEASVGEPHDAACEEQLGDTARVGTERVDAQRTGGEPTGEESGLVAILVQFLEPTTVHRFVQSIFIPAGVIWLGSRVAPSHREVVAGTLAGLLLLMEGAAFFAGLLIMDRPGNAGLLELSIAAGIWLVATGYTFKAVRDREREVGPPPLAISPSEV